MLHHEVDLKKFRSSFQGWKSFARERDREREKEGKRDRERDRERYRETQRE